MAWGILLIASMLEVIMGLSIKAAAGWTRPLPSVLAVVSGLISLYLLALATRTLPVGTAYAVWTGIGAASIALLGMLLFGDPVSWPRLLCIALIILAVAGLRFWGS